MSVAAAANAMHGGLEAHVTRTMPADIPPFFLPSFPKVVKRTQVVLTTPTLQNLGAEGALVAVRTGYFRNYLLPQGFAKVADEGILGAPPPF